MGPVMSMGRAAVFAVSAPFVFSNSALVDIDRLVRTTAIDWVHSIGQLVVVNSYSPSTRATNRARIVRPCRGNAKLRNATYVASNIIR
jgi:hypothetical protein